MTSEKLSERMRDDDSLSGSHFADKVEKLEQERDHLETVFSELGIAFDDLKREYETLKEQLSRCEHLRDENYGDAKTFLKRAEVAEAEIKRLKEQAFIAKPFEELRMQNLVILLASTEARLAKAQELLNKWRRYEKVDVAFPVDYHQCADELETALGDDK